MPIIKPKSKKTVFQKLLKEKVSKTTTKSKGLDFNRVRESLKECKWYVQEDERSISILLEGVRLVSLNEIFATLQTRPYEIFRYKKLCHELMAKVLSHTKIRFSDSVKITYFRGAPRFFDHDSLIPAFKYFLDGIVEEGIISDDNPNIIAEILPVQAKRKESLLGIRIEKVDQNNQTTDPFVDWNFVHYIGEEELSSDM